MTAGLFVDQPVDKIVEGYTLNGASLAVEGMESIFYKGEREVETNDAEIQHLHRSGSFAYALGTKGGARSS